MELIEDLGMVVYKTGKRKVHCALYLCPLCNTAYKARINDVKNGQTTKCAKCLAKSRSKKAKQINLLHGYTGHPIHNTWRGMLDRCYKVSCKRYKDYGGKGVTVCDEWKNDFIKFKDWALANGWQKGLQIDKDKLCYENNINPRIYSPSTCLWVTPKENSMYRKRYL